MRVGLQLGKLTFEARSDQRFVNIQIYNFEEHLQAASILSMLKSISYSPIFLKMLQAEFVMFKLDDNCNIS